MGSICGQHPHSVPLTPPPGFRCGRWDHWMAPGAFPDDVHCPRVHGRREPAEPRAGGTAFSVRISGASRSEGLRDPRAGGAPSLDRLGSPTSQIFFVEITETPQILSTLHSTLFSRPFFVSPSLKNSIHPRICSSFVSRMATILGVSRPAVSVLLKRKEIVIEQ